VASTRSSWDSYLILLPDGSPAAGMDGTGVAVFDNMTATEVYFNTAINLGTSGNQVLALSKTDPPQVQSAGGNTWPGWWGVSCDLPSASAGGRSYPFSKCIANGDSTVNMGADGVSMYNNQRFESPEGAARYSLPQPSNPTAFNSNYVAWPWWIRSDLSGRVYVYDGQFLTAYNKDTTQRWQMSYPTTDMATLTLVDDESAVLFSNESNLFALHPDTGSVMSAFTFAHDLSVESCWMQASPWAPATPVPLGDSATVAVVCTKKSGKVTKTVLATLDIKQKRVSTTEDLADPSPAMVIFDSAGFAYSFGGTKMPTVQRIQLPTPSIAVL